MTSLNSRLQLALLNRKKGRNLLEKGFTLVELMIVIVIVGVLSAVALPNFLNQTQKAKATECTQKLSSMLKQVHAEYMIDGNALNASKLLRAGATAATGDLIVNESDAGNWKYTIATAPAASSTTLDMECQAWDTTNNIPAAPYTATNIDDSLNAQKMHGCVNLTSGKVAVSKRLEPASQTYAQQTQVNC